MVDVVWSQWHLGPTVYLGPVGCILDDLVIPFNMLFQRQEFMVSLQ